MFNQKKQQQIQKHTLFPKKEKKLSWGLTHPPISEFFHFFLEICTKSPTLPSFSRICYFLIWQDILASSQPTDILAQPLSLK